MRAARHPAKPHERYDRQFQYRLHRQESCVQQVRVGRRPAGRAAAVAKDAHCAAPFGLKSLIMAIIAASPPISATTSHAHCSVRSDCSPLESVVTKMSAWPKPEAVARAKIVSTWARRRGAGGTAWSYAYSASIRND